MHGNPEIYNRICAIHCGSECGSGFQVAPDLVLTADHVIDPYFDKEKPSPVEVYFEGEEPIPSTVCYMQDNPEKPLAVLRLSSSRACATFQVSDTTPDEGSLARAYGFFPSTDMEAENIQLECVRYRDSVRNSCNCRFKPVDDRHASFKGFSGAPVFMKGFVIGMLLRQVSDNRTHMASRIRGICGSAYRNLLAEAGVEYQFCRTGEDTPDFSSGSPPAAQASMQNLISKIDALMSERFRQIQVSHFGSDIETEKQALKEFLAGLPDSGCSNAEMARCYYLGAIQLLLDHDLAAAETARDAAREADPGLDDSVYRAYGLLQQGLAERAKELLQPVDSAMKLDAYYSCLGVEHAQLSVFQDVLRDSGIHPNGQTLRLLAVAAIRSGCFEDGYRYVEEAKKTDIEDRWLPIVEALLLFWDAMDNVYVDAERTCFPVADNMRFVPDREQAEKLERSYHILEETYHSVCRSGGIEARSSYVWALLAVSAVLPRVDYAGWLDEFQKIRPFDPLNIVFRLNNRIAIPDDLRDGFLALPMPEADAGCHADARYRLLAFLGRIDEAREAFRANEESIASYYGASVEESRLQMLIDIGDFRSASDVLGKISITQEQRDRYEIAIQYGIKPKAFKQLVKRAIEFAKGTKKSIDFRNALAICRYYGKWAEALSTARTWWKASGELAALEAQAEALIHKNQCERSMKVIAKAEEKGDASAELKHHKINALLGMAQLEEAREIARELGDAGSDPRLAVFEARTFIREGRKQEAIDILRFYADTDRYDFEAYGFLAELLQGEHPDLAFHYAEICYRHAPGDDKVIKFAGNLALATGHDDSEVAAKFIMHIQKEARDGGPARIVTVEEAIKIIREVYECNKKLEDDYIDRKFPIHLFADSTNANLGNLIRSTLEGGSPYLGHFGVPKDIMPDFDRPLILDYTSCLILHRLGLLEKACSWFSGAWVEWNLFEIWLSDINKLKSNQKSVSDKAIHLSEEIRRLKFRCYPPDEQVARLGFDHVLLQCAEGASALLVSERAYGDLLGDSVPDGWENVRIHPHVLYAALDRLCLPHPDYADDLSPEGLVDRLFPRRALVLDRSVLDELLNSGALSYAFETFDVILPAELVNIIHTKADGFRNCAATAAWLEEAYSEAGRLCSQGRILLKPGNPPEKQSIGVYNQLLIDTLRLSSGSVAALALDDCLGNSYHRIGEGTPIVSTYDLISAAYRCGKLDEKDYYRAIDVLLSVGYGFFVPPSGYFLSRLAMAGTDEDGLLGETAELRDLRRMLALALDRDIGVRSRPIGAYNWPEIVGFLGELRNAFRYSLTGIWKLERPLEWRRAASDWLMAFAGDFICDIERFNATAEHALAFAQSVLLFIKVSCGGAGRLSEFADWLDPYLIASWWANLSFMPKAAAAIADFIHTTLLENPHIANNRKSKENVVSAYIYSLPYLIRPSVLQDPICRPYVQRFAALAEKDIQRVAALGDIRECIEGNPALDSVGILRGDGDAMDAATGYILSDIQAHSEEFIQEFPIEKMLEVPVERRYMLARFFANLSWYFPPFRRAHLHELKRRLSMYRD